MSQLQSEFQTNLLNKEKLENRYLLRIDFICLKLNYQNMFNYLGMINLLKKENQIFFDAAYLRINN